MKKFLVLITGILFCVCLVGCSSNGDEKQTTSGEKIVTAIPETTQLVTETERVTSTTSPAFEDSENGLMLSDTVKEVLADGDGSACSLTGDVKYGSFEFKLNDTDTAVMYSKEQSDEMQKAAEDNAKSLVDAISTYYPYEITFESTTPQQIGSGDNGIDSVVYVITYTNTQNQELTMRADSNGTIYYAYCNFTW